MSRQQPMLMESPLTKRVYVVTSYVDEGDGLFTAREKHDVTEQFDALAAIPRGECGLHDCEGSFSALNRPVWRCDCGAFMTQYTDATTYHKPRFCPNCGRKAVKR